MFQSNVVAAALLEVAVAALPGLAQQEGGRSEVSVQELESFVKSTEEGDKSASEADRLEEPLRSHAACL